jgi:hypothetical protein
MKNIFSKIIIAFITLVMLAGCSQEFLDAPKPTDKVSAEVVFSTRDGVEAFISGIMRQFRGQFPNAAGVSTTDAAGLNSIFFARSMKGNDLINTTTWFTNDYINDNREPTYRRTIFTWNYCFYMVNQANALINGVEASSLAPADKKELAAYGYALRGFFYHQLVMEFAPTYAFDLNYPAPPIYTSSSLTGNGMSTVKDVYALIVSDLTKAIAGLTEQRLGKSYINKSVANGILARVYQVMGNWAGAEVAAKAAYGGDPLAVLSASTYRSGFNDYTNIEWIWGSAQTADQTNYYYGFPHAGTDHLHTSYSSVYINRDFVSLFSPTDVRAIFQKKSASITNLNDYRYWITNKFTFTFDADHPIIRTPEMILIEAEAKLNQGQDTPAHDLLYILQKNRDVNAVRSTNTGDALLNEILVERRKELYAEIGVEWFDAKRLRRGITRTGNHRIGTLANLTADDKKFFLKIPQAEIDSNEFIDETVNNGR